jgi:hypothetical protein
VSPFDHQPLYCEENVYRLLGHSRLAGHRRYALFITNHERRVAMWAQRAADEDSAIVWDYHVVAVTLAPALVWDLDSWLPLPCALERYLAESFLPLARGSEGFAPSFRLVSADDLVATFASDRRHMRRPDGSLSAPPPPWPAIGEGHTLERYLDSEDAIAGRRIDSVAELRAVLARLEFTADGA